MPPTVYTTIISPNEVHVGDKVQIKGILKDNASEFSINFVNEICKNPSNITYHFKWILEENVLVQNYKDSGNWIRHMESSYDQFDGLLNSKNVPNSNDLYNDNNILHYSVLGTIFELEFAFQDDVVDVYKIYDNTPNRIASYELYFDISEIKALQVWGDVKKITELSYKYG